MRSGIDGVRRFYDLTAQEEDARLFKDRYHQLEFIVTMHYLRKHLPGSGRILDCGAGSGHYAIELAKMGYEVAVFDLSRELLKLARAKFEREGLAERLLAIVQGSSTNLGCFEDSYFDAALCLGPLYHLIEERDRDRTVRELWRVLRPGGVLFVSAISLFGIYGTVVAEFPWELTDERHQEMLERGIHRGKWHEDPRVFPDAYFWKPLDLKAFMEERGFETIEMAACEGVVTHLRESVNSLSEEQWERLKQIVVETSNDPTIIGHSEHFLWIGRKRPR